MAHVDISACPAPPEMSTVRNMTAAEAREIIKGWEKDGLPIPIEFMPLFWLRSAGACNFAIKNKAISAMYTGWHVSESK